MNLILANQKPMKNLRGDPMHPKLIGVLPKRIFVLKISAFGAMIK